MEPPNKLALPYNLSDPGSPRQAFVALLRYIEELPEGWTSIASGKRQDFFVEHNDRFFDENGPWANYRKRTAASTRRKFGNAFQVRKRDLVQGNYDGENMPEDLVLIKRYLEATRGSAIRLADPLPRTANANGEMGEDDEGSGGNEEQRGTGPASPMAQLPRVRRRDTDTSMRPERRQRLMNELEFGTNLLDSANSPLEPAAPQYVDGIVKLLQTLKETEEESEKEILRAVLATMQAEMEANVNARTERQQQQTRLWERWENRMNGFL